MTYGLKRIYDLGLSKVDDLNILLKEILAHTRLVMNCDGGSIYIKEDDDLSLKVFQNDFLDDKISKEDIICLQNLKLSLDNPRKYLAVESFVSNKILLIENIYDNTFYNFEGSKEFDLKYNYRTYSIMTVPLIHPLDGSKLGVIQLINKRKRDKLIEFSDNDKDTISLISSLVSFSIQKTKNDNDKLQKLNVELKKDNLELEKKVQQILEENERKSAIIYHQSKMASMGEMIENIAHQWRQPLSAISTTASGLDCESELNIISQEELSSGLNSIVETTNYLSETIDDFRNFYVIDKKETIFNISSIIDNSLAIINASLQDHGISVIVDVDVSVEIYGLKNEFKQALLNILINSKDALIEKKIIDDKTIFINLHKKDNETVINIKDNAEGINENIIDNIFDRDFTTKSSKGTGIGLYMTKEIIETHMKGKVIVENENFIHNGKNYQGAKFSIIFS